MMLASISRVIHSWHGTTCLYFGLCYMNYAFQKAEVGRGGGWNWATMPLKHTSFIPLGLICIEINCVFWRDPLENEKHTDELTCCTWNGVSGSNTGSFDRDRTFDTMVLDSWRHIQNDVIYAWRRSDFFFVAQDVIHYVLYSNTWNFPLALWLG